jgi:RimJ/RimL family protein N-acetyltransferase
MDSFRITPVEFDSGRLAAKVGRIELSAASGVGGAFAEQVRRRGREEGYHLLYFASPDVLEVSGFQHVGTLVQYAGNVEAVQRKLAIAARALCVREVSDDDWNQIEELTQFEPDTRFGRDRRLSPATVRRHKLELLRACRRLHPNLALLATVNEGRAIGFQFSRISEGAADFYEVCVAPDHRRSHVACMLLAENLDRMRQAHSGLERVTTRVYEHNTASQAFFARIGMTPVSREHWHHLWIHVRQDEEDARRDSKVPVAVAAD